MADLNLRGSLAELVECPEAVRRALYNYTTFPYVMTARDNWSTPRTMNTEEVESGSVAEE